MKLIWIRWRLARLDAYEIAIKSLLNHYYSLDISKKVKSVVKQKQISGEYVAARLPYGYEKLVVEGRTIYVTDPEKAEVVKKVFELILDGDSYYKIVGKLNLAGVKSPGGNDWNVKAVSRIINNRFYTGVIEMGKTENTLGGMKPFIDIEKQDWIIIDNHHEAIVDIDAFENVQRIIEENKEKRVKTNNKTNGKNETIKTRENKFDRLLYCGNCGRKMKKQVWAAKIYYVCPKYSETNGMCTLKSWRVDRVINALIGEIEDQILILENGHEKYDEGFSFKDQILLFQNEIDRLKIKREFTYDAFVENNGYRCKDLRSDLDLIDKKIKDTENEINELTYYENTLKNAHDKTNLLKQVKEELKSPNSNDHNDVQDFDCIIKKINVFENLIEIEY